MKAPYYLLVGVAVGAGLTWGAMRWSIVACQGPHKHVWGRWQDAEPMVSRSGPYAINERHCVRCGYREIGLAMPGCAPAEE